MHIKGATCGTETADGASDGIGRNFGGEATEAEAAGFENEVTAERQGKRI
jgi:hypothetical protein